jgi:MFS transporter, DHA2 family, multidrug resistance protein
VFLVSVPVMLLLLAVGPALLPEYRDPAAGRLDVFSAALSLTAILAVIFGLKVIAQDGPGAVPVLAIVAGLAMGAAFVRRQLTLDDPLIDLRLFGLPGFSASLAAYGLGILAVFGGFLFLPQYLQLVRGLSPFESGFWTLPWAVAFVLGSLVTPILARRVRPARLMTLGLLLATAGFAVFGGLDGSTTFATFALGTFAFSLGMSPVFTLATDLVIGSAPPERAGAASAISETSAEFGGALGIAIFGSIGVAVYRSAMADAVPPEVPLEAAAAARATLGGALATARELPGSLGPELTDAARTAFIRGVRICAGISTAGALALALLPALLLRSVRPSSDPEPAAAVKPSAS